MPSGWAPFAQQSTGPPRAAAADAPTWTTGAARYSHAIAIASAEAWGRNRPITAIFSLDMGFSPLDYLVLVIYLVGITLFGMQFRRSQHTVTDYFRGNRTTSWWVISLS